MSETTYTKGPWEWRIDKNDTVSLEPGVLITDYTDGTPWGDKIDKANARLIAAAPDLLECAIETRKLVSEAAAVGFNPHDGDWAIRLYTNNGKLSAAISKVEGRS